MKLLGNFAGRYRYDQAPRATYFGEWFHSPRGELWVAAAGFVTPDGLTNSEQLASRRGPMLASGYQKWGTALSCHLLGQYCGVVIDDNLRQAFLVQDSLGTHTLYYAFNGSELLFADHIADIVGMLDYRRLDMEYVADYLALGCCCTSATPFRGVKRLVGGTSLLVNERIILERPWYPSSSIGFDHWREQDRAERLPQLLIAALEPLRQHRKTAWCDVSGGMDSTTVYFTARQMGLDVEPFSVVSRAGDDDGDTEVLSHLFADDDSTWHRIDVAEAAPFSVVPDLSGYEPGGEVGFSMRRALDARLLDAGITVVLSGMGGDQVFGSVDCAPSSMVDYLYLFQIKRLRRSAKAWAQQYPERRSIWFWLMQYGARPLYDHVRKRRRLQDMLPTVSWIRRQFASEHSLLERADSVSFSSHPQPGRRVFWEEIFRTCAVEAASRMHRFAAPYYYPLLFRPLVEFMASVPNEERRTPREDRVLQRRAFQGIVPQIVLERRGKGSGQRAFDRSIRVAEPWHDLLRRSRLVEMGVFDEHTWQAALERARHGVFEALPTLCASISIEMWLQGDLGRDLV